MEISVSAFKKDSSFFLKRASNRKEEICLTRYGKPVARVIPTTKRSVSNKTKSLFGIMKGQIKILGDIETPIDVKWEVV